MVSDVLFIEGKGVLQANGGLIIGAHESIGVFVWTSKSYSDRRVPQGAPTLRLPSTNLTAELLAAKIGDERA